MNIPMEYGSSFEIVKSEGDGTNLDDRPNVLYLRTAREALFYICQCEKRRIVFLPSLCCVSMIQPFIQAGMDVRYYKVLSDLRIDISDLHNKLEENAIVLVMHYYGIRAYSKQEISNIKNTKKNVIIIQDCTQHVFTYSLFDDVADYWIGSIRKWVSIADGAFLASRKHNLYNLQEVFNEDDGFVEKTFTAMKLKYTYLQNCDLNIKEIYRKKFAECMAQLKENITIHTMSDLSRKMFTDYVDCQNLRQQRAKNYLVLYTSLKSVFPQVVRYSIIQESPLCFNIVIKDRDDIQNKLASLCIYCQVLWPITKEAKNTCEFSKWFSEHMLAIPCDQRYKEEDMLYIAQKIRSVISEKIKDGDCLI